MINRLQYAFQELIAFAKNPSLHFKQADNSYKQLLDIAWVLAFVSMLDTTISESLYGLDSFVYVLLASIIIARIAAWLNLNFNAVIFDYYLDKIIFRKFIAGQSDILKTQKILVYSSLSMILGLLPIPSSQYIALFLYLFFLSKGLTILYDINNKQAWIIAGIYTGAWALVGIIIYLVISSSL